MNFLAHLHLSGNDPSILVGNFIGDFVKGKQLNEFEAKVQQGISLHRMIDHFTDTHKIVDLSKSRLRGKYRHYAGVIVDIFYDHFLAKNWGQYSNLPLTDFASRCYQTVQMHSAILPERVNYMLPYMIRQNWLVSYAEIEGISQALHGMSRRTKFNSRMEEAPEDLRAHYEEFEGEFTAFYPELQKLAAEFIN